MTLCLTNLSLHINVRLNADAQSAQSVAEITLKIKVEIKITDEQNKFEKSSWKQSYTIVCRLCS